jgi:hypothetical protein
MTQNQININNRKKLEFINEFIRRRKETRNPIDSSNIAKTGEKIKVKTYSSVYLLACFERISKNEIIFCLSSFFFVMIFNL